jgi:hypothetical protein
MVLERPSDCPLSLKVSTCPPGAMLGSLSAAAKLSRSGNRFDKAAPPLPPGPPDPIARSLAQPAVDKPGLALLLVPARPRRNVRTSTLSSSAAS